MYDTGDNAGVGIGSLTVGPARVHGPSAHIKTVDERGRKEIQLGAGLVEAELGPLRTDIGPAMKFGTRDENGIGFTAETKIAEARLGPLGAKIGLGISTGIHSDDDSTGFQFLGTGVDMGKNGIGVNVLGSRAECSIM